MRSKPFAPRGAFLSDPPPPAGCTCRRLRRGWERNPRCPKHGDPLAAPTPPIPLWCKQCGRTWTQTIALPLPVDDAVRRLKAITRLGCPHCGANGLNGAARHAAGRGESQGRRRGNRFGD